MNSKFKNMVIKRVPGAVWLYLTLRKLYAIPSFVATYFRLRYRIRSDGRFNMPLNEITPLLLDKTATTGFEPHYVYHPAWAARIVKESGVREHIDISSTLAFSAIVSAFLPVKFYDYRPAPLFLDNLSSESADLTKLFFADNSIQSLSCMHTIEHIGLGRYGDEVDVAGDKKSTAELSRVLAPAGRLIFVTPVGRPRLVYNAHRVYSYQQVLDLFPTLTLVEFSIVPDEYKTHGLIRNADPEMVKDQEYACGCFVFTK